ncbi:MAG: CDP-alcohol phosphatidyltransferase family protein [Clostridiales bacterium]|nr:CDP-alcohol phosphatidyltransferase family protein [Clostridiales bacterium]
MQEKKEKEEEKESKIITVPNIMSLFRIILIPFIVWNYGAGRRRIAFSLLVISWLTDILDGQIARQFHMVSHLGKALDPLADKLTQGFLMLTLISEFPVIKIPFLVFILVEAVMVVTGILVIKRTGSTYSASWHGKLATGMLDITVIFHIIWQDIPAGFSSLLVSACIVLMLLSLLLYIIENRKRIQSGKG